MRKLSGDLVLMFNWGAFDVIAHGCNCHNIMGAGIAKTIRTHYPQVFETDASFSIPLGKERLGHISICPLDNPYSKRRQFVVNCYTQDRIANVNHTAPFDKDAFRNALDKLYNVNNYQFEDERVGRIQLGIPYIGAGLAGGNKEEVESIIQEYADKYESQFETTLVDYSQESITLFRNDYWFLSNLYPVKIAIKLGEEHYVFPNLETAYFSFKSHDKKWKRKCEALNLFEKGSQKALRASSFKVQLVDNWDNLKGQIMWKLLQIKFSNPTLRAMLLNTKGMIIHGNAHREYIWGVNGENVWQGQNRLGMMLMRLREDLQKDQSIQNI